MKIKHTVKRKINFALKWNENNDKERNLKLFKKRNEVFVFLKKTKPKLSMDKEKCIENDIVLKRVLFVCIDLKGMEWGSRHREIFSKGLEQRNKLFKNCC